MSILPRSGNYTFETSSDDTDRTEDNTEAILNLLDGGKDVLEIDIQGAPPAEDSATEQTQR